MSRQEYAIKAENIEKNYHRGIIDVETFEQLMDDLADAFIREYSNGNAG